MRTTPDLKKAAAGKRQRGDLRYRTGVAARVVTAIAGGYVLSALAAASLATWLPMARAEAAITATLAALVIYPCAAMWCFAARSASRAAGGLIAAGGIPACLLLLRQMSAGAV
jgi:hypothetical protein